MRRNGSSAGILGLRAQHGPGSASSLGARTGVGEGRSAMERMSTLDAGFFFVEDENTPMHVGSVAVFEGPSPSYGDVVRLLVARLSDVPRYRQRVRTVPLHLGRPVWTDDPH